MLDYVLLTAARNEERLIEQTIRSVRAQTVRPLRWIICSDGSTDGTDDIVRRHAADCNWISLLRMAEHRDRHFAAKVECISAAYDTLHGVEFDVIGSLDADITFEPDYFSFLLSKFQLSPELGVVGTRFIENGRQLYDYKFMNENHVSGGCQMFRRACFEAIGGYLPMKGGGEDWAAVTTARMKGWQTRSYTEKLFVHHRAMGTGGQTGLHALHRQGQRDYLTGGHPLWQVFRSVFQMTRRPWLVGGLCLLSGYTAALLRQIERPVSPELVRFHRKEQMARLRHAVFSSKGTGK